MPTLKVVQTANAAFKPSYVPIMVVTGSTLGIGKSIAEIFAGYQIGRAHIVLIARNKDAADRIMAGMPPAVTQEGCTYEFVECDLRLMKNVHEVSKELIKRLPKINFLVLSAGAQRVRGRVETEEGIDELMAVRYYCRFALTYDLMPLLRKARDAGEKAGVMSILGAGISPEPWMDDLSLKKNYMWWRAILQTGTYNEFMMAEFATREPGISFVYTRPGAVNTMNPSATHWKLLKFVLYPLIWLLYMTPEVSAEHMLYALLTSDAGLTRRGPRGDDLRMKGFPTTPGGQEAVWEHSMKETGAVDLVLPS